MLGLHPLLFARVRSATRRALNRARTSRSELPRPSTWNTSIIGCTRASSIRMSVVTTADWAIPRGARVELIVRVMRDNDLILDLESVNVNGERYAVQTEKNRVQADRDNSLLGSIVGAINGGQAKAEAIRIPRDTSLNFRVHAPLFVGVADRGVDRDGNHYHDWYRKDDYYRREP